MNTLIYVLTQLGEHQSAIDEHECELLNCQALKDTTGEGIAHRKLGECYMEMMELDTAVKVGYACRMFISTKVFKHQEIFENIQPKNFESERKLENPILIAVRRP